MKRKFKFRIWHKPFKRFLTPDEWFIGQDGEVMFLADFGEPINCKEETTIQQFTGELDKNDKEIYEGDIIHFQFKMDEHGGYEEGKGEVFFDEGQFLIDRFYLFSFCEVKARNRTVIGDMFKNKLALS